MGVYQRKSPAIRNQQVESRADIGKPVTASERQQLIRKIKRYEKRITKLVDRTDKYQKEIKKLESRVRIASHHKSVNTKRQRNEKNKWVKKYNNLKASIGYIIPNDDWNKGVSKALHLEIIIRTIISYKKMIEDGMVAYSELCFLLTGSQLEIFTRSDIIAKYGLFETPAAMTTHLRLCVEAGLLGCVGRKQTARYYITKDGTERLNSILSYIYSQKGTGYPITKQFDES